MLPLMPLFLVEGQKKSRHFLIRMKRSPLNRTLQYLPIWLTPFISNKLKPMFALGPLPTPLQRPPARQNETTQIFAGTLF